MASYNFVYFDLRGRGESIRLLLALSGVAYTEERISMEEWPKIKSSKLSIKTYVNSKYFAPSTVMLRSDEGLVMDES
jgi:hypothetical protein